MPEREWTAYYPFQCRWTFRICAFELSNEIKVYSYNGNGDVPEFELLQSVSTLAKKEDGNVSHNAASGLALAPDGKHLFCTTAGENTVGMFEVDAETGLLERKFVLPVSGDYPKDLVIFPDNQHIAVANHSSTHYHLQG